MFISKHDYIVNLSPAVMTLPFGANIDMLNTVRYKNEMEYGLGAPSTILLRRWSERRSKTTDNAPYLG